jgi:L-malate glycosyltransferase
MRIGIISTIDGLGWGGGEELWADMALSASQSGIRVSVCLLRPWPNHSKWLALKRAGADLFCESESPYLRAQRPARLAGVLHQKLGEFVANRLSPSRPFLSTRPDVLLVNDGGLLPSISFIDTIRERFSPKPYVVLSQANRGQIVETTYRNKAAAFYREAHAALFVSESNLHATEQQLLQKLPNARVVRNPVNLTTPDPVEWPKHQAIKLASVARLYVVEKGQDILLEVLSHQQWRHRDWHLSLFGTGSDADYLQGLSAYYGLTNRVSFCGQTEDIRKVWETHHALMLPSRSEGTPLAMVEAMLCGRPVIGTAVAGIPEWVRDGRSGFIADAATVKSFSAALENAWQQRARWPEMGRNAREDALLLYDPSPGETLLSIIIDAAQTADTCAERFSAKVLPPSRQSDYGIRLDHNSRV